jgi:hypothetical protein
MGVSLILAGLVELYGVLFEPFIQFFGGLVDDQGQASLLDIQIELIDHLPEFLDPIEELIHPKNRNKKTIR